MPVELANPPGKKNKTKKLVARTTVETPSIVKMPFYTAQRSLKLIT